MASVRKRFEQAQYLIARLAYSEHLLIRAELAIVQGRLFLQQGTYSLALERFQKASEWLPIDERSMRLLTHQQCGICSILLGQPIHEGIDYFQQALQLCDPQREAELIGELHHQF